MNKSQLELFGTDTPQPDLMDSQENETTFISVMALNSIKGVGQKTIQQIYDLGIINTIWHLKQSELDNSLANLGRKKLNLSQIINKEKNKLLQNGEQKTKNLISQGIRFISNKYKDFPQALNTLSAPPRWLFAMGNTNVLLSKGIIAIIGTRQASHEGKSVAYHLAKEFVFRNIVVLSGLAEGIDSQAHKGAVDHYGQSIGILGHGFEATYATKDKHLWDDIVERDGAVITEYLPDESPSRENFLKRNELQAALSHLVIPIEAPDLASGTGATIRRALSQKTLLLGIDLDQRDSQSIKKTADNLRNLNIPIFNLPSEDEKFWEFVRSALPDHNWNTNPRERQKRFVNKLFGNIFIIDSFIDELRRASFNDNDIDWLANEIKRRMG